MFQATLPTARFSPRPTVVSLLELLLLEEDEDEEEEDELVSWLPPPPKTATTTISNTKSPQGPHIPQAEYASQRTSPFPQVFACCREGRSSIPYPPRSRAFSTGVLLLTCRNAVPCYRQANLASIHQPPRRGVLKPEKMQRVSAHPKNRATMSSMIPIVATFHTSERISGTPAA